MKKITNFIVDKRYFILPLFIVLGVISLVASKNVNINYDMAKYLDKDSDTRIGLDIMEENFKDDSTLELIVANLDNERESKEQVFLESIDNIKSVTTEEKENYTKYILTFDDVSKEKMSDVYELVTKHFQNDEYYTYGDVANENKEVLPFYIIVIAVLSAMVILIFASSSYVEPFLFLFSILLAVLLNKGTNALLPSISNITEGIVAILQMALSMDYSIMLMNRYNEEKLREKDKVKAMKKALHNSFKSISSSSITTIVGLLALVFMNYKIGLDLGFVLAKGVLFSLLVIFTCLPALILIFDNLINKTKKKSPVVKLNFLASFTSKHHYLLTFIFILIFVLSFVLKGNLTYTYTDKCSDEVESLFLDNEMALLYETKDEDKFSNYCASLENNANVRDILCYSNTINLPLKSSDVNEKLQELDSDKYIDDYLLKIIYYHYYNSKEDNKITLDNLINFIKKDVYSNDKFNTSLDEEMQKDIDRLNNFSNKNNITKLRSQEEIMDVLDIDQNTLNKLLIYYHSLNQNIKLTSAAFIKFMNNNIVNNEEYNQNIDLNSYQNLVKLTSDDVINSKFNYLEMASILNNDKSNIKNIYLLIASLDIASEKLSMVDIVKTIKNNNITLSDDANNKLNLIEKFSDQTFILKNRTKEEISELFNIDENIIGYIYSLNNKEEMSIYDLVNFVVKNNLTSNDDLKLISLVMESSINNLTYSYEDVSTLLNIDSNSLKNLYILNKGDNLKLSILELTTFIIDNQDNPLLKGSLSKDVLNNIITINTLIKNKISNYEYSSQELSQLLDMNKEDLDLIYGMYDIMENKYPVKVSFQEFINFLNDKVLNNSKYSQNFSAEAKNNLQTVLKIMNNSLNNKKYSKEELTDILSTLKNDLDKDLVSLVYIYYGSVNDYNEDYTLTIFDFISYLHNDILNDKRFIPYITDKEKEDIITSYNDVLESKEKLVNDKYSRMVIDVNLPYEGKETYDFIQNINNDIKALSSKAYLVGDSTLAYEMNNNFASELNLITVLTIIFIFVVVLFTFKSFIIPILLVLIIQTSVFLIMGILSFSGDALYFISILIVQSILMGATIDYAIVYTSYYLEERQKMNIKDALKAAYVNSLHTILTSASILIIVTLIVGLFSSQIAAKICRTLSFGTICSSVLIIFFLPSLLATFDKLITKKKC